MKKVLVVDDIGIIRRHFRTLLSNLGCEEIIEATNGVEAMVKASQHKPDLIFLDLLMPVMNGYEALPKLRESCPNARIVIVSSVEAVQKEEWCYENGADAYFEKPLSQYKIAEVAGISSFAV